MGITTKTFTVTIVPVDVQPSDSNPNAVQLAVGGSQFDDQIDVHLDNDHGQITYQVSIHSRNGKTIVKKLDTGNVTLTHPLAKVLVFSLDGNDTIHVDNGDTGLPAWIFAGNGNDKVDVGNGDNRIMVGNGSDQIHAGNGNNTIIAGNGADDIHAGNGNNSVVAGNGNDEIHLGNGDNNVTVGNGNDDIDLGNGNNVIVTGSGHDHVHTGKGHNLWTHDATAALALLTKYRSGQPGG
jgi:Ca2+-binding RTX toxin-like protein